ncbi:conserved hypothetical protein [Uncinocarpus reesii 1704]|uniref:STAS domain-containing protein n=1 Tax=Uncinocarpus reesii (strain UAMH 1704) TaxID=336963 RepID=C4JL01_UNCRE|nr:uncharacterized protein UREG_00216 [Uncinocarpus reesii 1704]EEP75370.1 conserved hypothetical protein [Uncinocarpus reesii 1704]
MTRPATDSQAGSDLMEDEGSRLLDSDRTNIASGGSGHGTFSSDSQTYLDHGTNIGPGQQHGSSFPESSSQSVRGDGISSIPLHVATGKSATKQLADVHGVKNQKIMYLSYYVPFFNWISQYQWKYLRGDFVSALTVASVYIPLGLSLASNVAHIPALNGLYSFVFHPFIYALLGSSPQVIVGPEAPGSLLVGTVVRSAVNDGKSIDDDLLANAQIAGIVTGMAGAMILIAGLTRLGFLDNILSRPFLRGFISAIGFVIFVDQLVPEMGLNNRAKDNGLVTHGSSWDKLMFLFQNAQYSHALTCAVAFGSFAIIMMFRTMKKYLEPRFPTIVFFPDQLLVVVLSAVLTWKLGWDKKGLDILGDVRESGNHSFAFRWPFHWEQLDHIRTAMSTSFIISLLGFFESSIAAKGLRNTGRDGIDGMTYSPNRELVALGAANIIGGCFMALPSFGGYGRSKLSAATGAKTPMSSVFLCLITVICIVYLLPWFYYLPMSVLSAVISVVSWSLIEECPHDIRFFIRIRGWSELILMLLIFLSTVFYSLYLGIALGMGLSILQVIRHATKPRIQILGKVSGTDSRFENAELHPERVEFIEGCLIVKIPEPLTFANTGDLKNRLRRLEFYGTNAAHPALPRVRSPEHNRNMIFDIHGVTSIDGSGIQELSEIVQEYVKQDVRVFFCRIPRPESGVFRLMVKSGIVDICGGMTHFVESVDEALKLTETPHVHED